MEILWRKFGHPDPGTSDARAGGCTCPVMDNSHGKGRGGDGVRYGWWIVEGCPMHAPKKLPSEAP